MKTIYKYELEIKDSQTLMIPNEAEILSVQVQFDEPKLWAMCDPEKSKESRVICMFGTGSSIPSKNLKFIGTFQALRGQAVFHVFEQI